MKSFEQLGGLEKFDGSRGAAVPEVNVVYFRTTLEL
jgi:hypothetical protein